MLKAQGEIRMIWLMVLIICAVGAWFLAVPTLTYLCLIAFVMSVIQYVDAIQKPIDVIAQQSTYQVEYTSKVPLYISSIIALVGGLLSLSWMVTIGATLWIFFFLRWLRRLETNLEVMNYRQLMIIHQQQSQTSKSHSNIELSLDQSSDQFANQTISAVSNHTNPLTAHEQLGFMEQMSQWIFKGNPVLKVAILVLVIGVILLLRFATEHWQLSLALKLGIVTLISAVVTAIGYSLKNKNRSFSLALEGLGQAGLFLTLFFAYYNQVIGTLIIAALCYAIIMMLTLYLSLKQQSIELALMAMLIAYLAPFTLPVRDATAVEFVAYYVVINSAVAILTTLRPWKILNQIAFLATVFIAGGYAFLNGSDYDRPMMTILVLIHTAIFVWLGFRFSQLIAQTDLDQFKLKPVLDVALIFSAPIVGFGFIYLMYFQDSFWQSGMSLVFALSYGVLYLLAKRSHVISMIAQSYFSLMLIFLALIPPILLKQEWSVIGWSVEGLVIFIFALYRNSSISRYLAMGLFIVAGLTSLYYWVELPEFPRLMFSVLTLCYFAALYIANFKVSFQKQLSMATTVFLSLMSIAATTMLLILCLDYFDSSNQWVMSLLVGAITLMLINESLFDAKALWSWLLPKWFGLMVLFIFAFGVLIHYSQGGVVLWTTAFNRIGFAFAGLMMARLWLRPMLGLNTEREWVSLGVLSSLALASLTLVPSMPFISVVMLPLVFCIWCYFNKNDADWQIFWQSRSSLLLMMVWIICSQLFSQQAFQGYFFVIINPFDLVSLAMLAGFLWMLSLQLKAGLDQGIIAILVVLSLLWLSSYILLRALHIYFDTPYNDLTIWGNALVQLSLTLLWVSLAFITMSLASRKQIRSVWILGASILFIVTLKLVLFDLSHIGTLTRVISFLGAGLVMLIIAYIAPIPESEQAIKHEVG